MNRRYNFDDITASNVSPFVFPDPRKEMDSEAYCHQVVARVKDTLSTFKWFKGLQVDGIDQAYTNGQPVERTANEIATTMLVNYGFTHEPSFIPSPVHF